MIKCVAFDFDGTLVDSNHIKQHAFYDAVAHLPGAEAVIAAVLRDAPGDRYQIFERFTADWNRQARSGSTAVQASSLSEAYTRHCEDAIASSSEFPGAAQLLSSLNASGVSTALVSATPSAPLEALIIRKQWRDRFAHIIGGATDKAFGLRELARREGVQATALVMIGDRQVDQDGATAVGCAFIGVRRADNDFTVQPRLMVDDLTEVTGLLDRLGGSAT